MVNRKAGKLVSNR